MHPPTGLGTSVDPRVEWPVQQGHREKRASCYRPVTALLPLPHCARASQLSSANSPGPTCPVGHLHRGISHPDSQSRRGASGWRVVCISAPGSSMPHHLLWWCQEQTQHGTGSMPCTADWWVYKSKPSVHSAPLKCFLSEAWSPSAWGLGC